jgi:hypothetical protein
MANLENSIKNVKKETVGFYDPDGVTEAVEDIFMNNH